MDAELENELLQLATLLEARDEPGSMPGTKEAKIKRVMRWLRDTVCPHKAKILAATNTSSAKATAAVADAIIAGLIKLHLIGLHFVPVNITKLLMEGGLEQFCRGWKSPVD